MGTQTERTVSSSTIVYIVVSAGYIIRLSSRQSSLETAIKSKQNQTQALEEKLSGLQPSLEQLRVATVPLQEFFGITLDWEREQYHLAILLPR